MQVRFGIFCFLLIGLTQTLAQGIKGTITNEKGEFLPYVTIYSPTSKTGTNSNLKGQYQLKLPKGTHQITFHSIDYQSQTKTIEIKDEAVVLNLVLMEQTYNLKEVKVMSKNENPADYIMRKAIAAAPYYRRQILSYQARVYVKGTGRIDESPRLLKGIIKDQGIEVGKSYVSESIIDLQFKQPQTYREKVISLKSTMPFKDGPEPMRMARGSMYATGNGTFVSPLSPQAFGVYQFVLEGSFYENGREINKIRVQPKRKGNDLYSGTLFIFEDLWCLHSCVLVANELGMTTTIKTSFKPLADYPFVYLPVTYDISAIGDYLGIKGSFRYLASMANYQITLNPNLNHDWVQKKTLPKISEKEVPIEPIKPTKKQEEIIALQKKEKLSKREMVLLASKMRKEAERETQNLMRENDSSDLVIDSLALKRDSSFWLQNRPVPLLDDELKSFEEKAKKYTFKVDSLGQTRKKTPKITLGEILFSGDSIPFKAGKYYFSEKGLVGSPSINTVEGIAFQTGYSFGNTKPNAIRFTQMLRVPLEMPRVQTTLELSYRFDPKRVGIAILKGGSIIQDYNPRGISPYTDAFNLLLLKRNFSRFYQQDFIQLAFSRELTTGLNFGIQLMGSNRYSIDNLKRFDEKVGTFGYQLNIPIGKIHQPTQMSFQYGFNLSYKPFQQYRMRHNKKYYLPNNWPGILVQYKEGRNSQLLFKKVEASIDQDIPLRHWVRLKYQVKGGLFLNNHEVHFADYFHFAGNLSPIYEGNSFSRFQQLPYYQYSTRLSYQSAFLQFELKRFLLKRLPVLNLMDFKEQVYFNYLQTPDNPVFFETGYRINRIFQYFGLGVNAHFMNQKYMGSNILLTITY